MTITAQRSGSVLFIIEPQNISDLTVDWLHQAQAQAIRLQLPLAAIYFLEDIASESVVDELQRVESALHPYAIALLTMVGSQAERLPWLSGHVAPQAVYSSSETHDRQGLIVHPHKWPGVVMPVSSVIEHQLAVIRGEQKSC